MRWLRRLAYWLRFSSRDDELREELALHHELLADDLERRGLTAQAAAVAAQRAMGNATYMREGAREVWLWPRLDALLQDSRHAWRGLRRSPGFALVAIVSLAVGIGANAAIFSLLRDVLLARVPAPNAAQLVQLRRDYGPRGIDEQFSRAELTAMRSGPLELSLFSSVSATLEIDGFVRNASLDAIDARFTDILGLHAQRGRLISESDDAAAIPVAVISDRLWRGPMNADPAVIGRTIQINRHPVTIIGVTPPGFAGMRFPPMADVEMPFRAASALEIVRAGDSHRPVGAIIARRPDGMSIARAKDALSTVWNRCCAAGENLAVRPGVSSASTLALADASRGIELMKLDIRGRYSRILIALMAGVGILLLAACANVANLLLARSSARASELAVRRALGASRTRLVGQLVIESVQLSILGVLAGLLLARWSMAWMATENLGDLKGVMSPSLSPTVLVFAIVVSLISGIVFGVIPAIRVLRSDLLTPLKHGARRSVRGRRGWLDRGLVAVQMALALLLVSGATLLVRTLENLQDTDLGFDPVQRIAVSVETRRTSYERSGMTSRMVGEMLDRVRALPGVESAGFGSLVPIHGGRSVSDNVFVRGSAPLADGDANTWFVAVTPQYFAALRMPLLAGHDIGQPIASPTARSRDVVVNDLFAKKFFPNRDALGQVFSDSSETLVTENRVIGIVGNAKFTSARAPATPMYFVPVADHDWPFLVLVVKPSRGAAAIAPALSRTIAAIAPGISIGDPTPLSASIDDALARERIAATVATFFGAVALGLVAVGLYGVMLYQVAARTAEIGIRMALGARAKSVVTLVLRESLAIVGVGVIIGAPLAMLAGRAVASQLYGVAPYSFVALAIAAGSLVAVALVASFVPVRRAVSVDPLTALRAE